MKSIVSNHQAVLLPNGRRKRVKIKEHGFTAAGQLPRLYRIWQGMRRRCYAPKCDAYRNYGARGIGIYRDWYDHFISFREWAINNGYQDHLQLDRIDNNSDYSPENCRWVTAKVNALNKRNTRFPGFSLKELASRIGLCTSGLRARLKVGMSLEQALKRPRKHGLKFETGGTS